MSPNVELLKATLAYIEAHPDEWDQTWWRCNTGMCFAGTAATLAGGRWLVPADRDPGTLSGLDQVYLHAEPEDNETYVTEMDDQRVIAVEFRATRVLGLNVADGELPPLFWTGNTLGDLRQIVTDLCEEANQR